MDDLIEQRRREEEAGIREQHIPIRVYMYAVYTLLRIAFVSLLVVATLLLAIFL